MKIRMKSLYRNEKKILWAMMISSFKTDTFCQFTHKRLNHAIFFSQNKQDITSINSAAGAFLCICGCSFKAPSLHWIFQSLALLAHQSGQDISRWNPLAQQSMLSFCVPSPIPRSPVILILFPWGASEDFCWTARQCICILYLNFK